MSQQLITEVQSKLGCSKTEAAKAVKAVTDSIKEIASKKGSVTIVNFGSFTVKPFNRTSKLHGKEYKVSKNIVRFKPGKGFDELINS